MTGERADGGHLSNPPLSMCQLLLDTEIITV